jgi:potassium-dependent mechanosensitive channel
MRSTLACKQLLLFTALFFLFLPLLAQQPADTTSEQTDSLLTEHKPITPSDTSVTTLLLKIEKLSESLNKINTTLKRGFDTMAIADDLPPIEDEIAVLKQTMETYGDRVNLRNLRAGFVYLSQTEKTLAGWQKKLLDYTGKLSGIAKEMDELASDPTFKSIRSDSALLILYKKQLTGLYQKRKQTDSAKTAAFKTIGVLQNRVLTQYLLASDMLSDVKYRINNSTLTMWRREEAPLWKEQFANYAKSFGTVLKESYQKAVEVLGYYIQYSWKTRATMWFFVIAFCVWVFYNKRKVSKLDEGAALSQLHYLKKPLWQIGPTILFALAPFVYVNPPAVYVELLWLLMYAGITLIMWNEWQPIFKKYWLIIGGFYVLFGIDNLLIASSWGERWWLLGLSMAAVVTGLLMLRLIKQPAAAMPWFSKYVLWVFVAGNVLSVLFNITGRFSLAKVFGNAAVMGVVAAIALHVLVQLVLEAAYLQSEAMRETRFHAVFRYNDLKNKLARVLRIVAIIGWCMALAWNLNLYGLLIEGIAAILDKQRSIGSLKFNWGSIFLFAFILWLSNSMAKLLTLFFGNTQQTFASTQKSKLGSWVLLLRLGILSIGFFIAVAAAGFSADKIAIVIGALGVGIGFGLQNIVNNLISGIILAFEKPMNIGDVIEVGNYTGTVKEIGIRSSKISTYDGAEIIVPNGNFISQQLFNWTHSNNYRRIELIIGVSYGSDLAKVNQLISTVLENNKEVARFPSYNVFTHEFANNAVNLRVLFWTADFDKSASLKSLVLEELYKTFKDNNITIPFPQQDIFIKNLPETGIK